LGRTGVYLDVRDHGEEEDDEAPSDVQAVRCLSCGTVYAKGKGAGSENKGCPECGYVGWLSANVTVSEEFERRHFGADRPRLPDA
jgi:phage FluMu protein Com